MRALSWIAFVPGIAAGAELNVTIKSSGLSTIDAIPGASITYEICGQLSDANNLGLARVLFDIDFTGGPLAPAHNPSSLPMSNFARPLGITNPGGFGGVEVDGDLIQVGGAQNTIKNGGKGVPFPSGEIVTNVGHSETVLVTGSLTAPLTAGSYELRVVGFSGAVVRDGQSGNAFWKTDPIKLGAVTRLVINVAAVIPDPVTAELPAIGKVRHVSFVVPVTSAGQETALRVELTSLHHPTSPPPGTPTFAAFEGTFRFVNSFGGSTVCIDSSTLGTSFRCGTLGCQPEYRDWATELAATTNPASTAGLIHVTGDSVPPSSTLNISHIGASCGAAPSANTCAVASPNFAVSTSRWGDVAGSGGGAPDGTANVIDIGLVVDNVKGLTTAIPERRAWMKSPPNTFGNPVNVIDIGLTVDAVKGLPYPYTIAACP